MGESGPSTTPSTDWTQLRFDTTPLDLRKYLETHRNSRLQSDAESCIRELAATTWEYWEPECYESLLRAAPWLVGFTVENGDLAPAGRALAVLPNLCTRLLLRLDVILANWLITSVFKAWLEGFRRRVENKTPIVRPADPSDAVKSLLHDVPISAHGLSSLWWQLVQSYSDFNKNPIYQTFSTKVAEFCLEAGCPAVTRSPSEDIYSLRNHLFSTDSAAREAELRKEIDDLRSANRSQQRIITNLAFRHLLEMLPPRDAKPGTSATAGWNAFFQSALKEAQRQLERGEMGHPLAPVLKKYPKLKQIENVGTNLYGTLSTNIHHFSGQYKVLDDQWNALEVDILRAITPLGENETESGIDWQMERFRYGSGTSLK
ncbi:hypothetical protein, variant [Cladophialophora immunda]|uniref:Uncharacterized protein n=1 Tax=Cladophialophora immunda TaxID=569365 RepID=A0A0D2D008_9EURO|nr:uncharacterized protein PV07_04970 [Cladophialophora immunda]XP_016249350.1 hypothetical protein, variant [Cladophialophora immunda]KIW29133.1 hypothetical protein PV07_04970 [Cladophialophora immunda]KIW29134.1 hypothetical protein, variant [Cladophialophora immunda]OQU96974.1 hypothetical protein CLAIMM_02979 [Cladophialophora immunda]